MLLTTMTMMITHRFGRDAEIAISSKLPLFDSLQSATRTRERVSPIHYIAILWADVQDTAVKSSWPVTRSQQRTNAVADTERHFVLGVARIFAVLLPQMLTTSFREGFTYNIPPQIQPSPPIFFLSWGCT